MALRRQRRSMLRLRTWLRRSYRGAISEKICFTYARFSAPPAAAALAVALSMSVASIASKVARRRCAGQAIFPAPPKMPARSYTDVSDQQVVVFAQEGREDAYRELIKRYERPVFSLIYRMVRDKETAEDLAQETFIKVLNNLDRYRPEFKFSSWLFKIANNITIDYLRRRHVDPVSIEGGPDAITAERARGTAVTLTSGGGSALAGPESLGLRTTDVDAVAG